MHSSQMINRRKFCKTAMTIGAMTYGASVFSWLNDADAQTTTLPDLVAVKNGEPDVMFDRAIAAIGGMARFIQAGQIVTVKPNIGWNRAPETGANTHPLLVKRIVEECLKVGAKKVYVFDNGVDSSLQTYKTSGIEEAAAAGGAIVVPAHTMNMYEEVTIPEAKRLTKTRVHKSLLESDVLINVPVLKHHFSSQITIAMKNLMGVVWDRNAYHSKGLHDCIADFCLYRKPTLNIVDAYRVTMANGPQRAREQDLQMMKTLLISPDMVAVDAAAAKLWGIDPEKIGHIRIGAEKQLGNMNLDQLKIERIVL